MNRETNKQMIIDLISNPDFMSRLVEQEDIQSVKDLFKSEANIELSEQEIVTLGNTIDKCYKQIKSLSDDETEGLSGGRDIPAKILGGFIGALSGAVVGKMGGGCVEVFSANFNELAEVGALLNGSGKKRKENFRQGGMVIGGVAGSLAGITAAQGICNFLRKGSKK